MVKLKIGSIVFLGVLGISLSSGVFAKSLDNSKSSDEWVGYGEAFGVLSFNGTETWNTGSVTNEEWNGSQFGLSGHAGRHINDVMSIQIDASAQNARVIYNSTRANDTWTYIGSAFHGTFHLSDTFYFGPLVSIGQMNYSLTSTSGYATLGLEAIYDSGDYRLYLQTGQVMAVSGIEASHDVRDIYAMFLATYYLNPNLALSGTAGFDRYTSDDQNNWYNPTIETRFGVRLDYKPETMPFTIFATLSAWQWGGDYASGASTFKGGSDYFYVGLALPLGPKSIKEMHQRVGLIDFNPMYGQFNY